MPGPIVLLNKTSLKAGLRELVRLAVEKMPNGLSGEKRPATSWGPSVTGPGRIARRTTPDTTDAGP